MKNCKRALSILLACLMLMGVMPIAAVAAEGTQDNPINANDKWFGYGVDTYLLNPTIAEGTTDGVWYELTVEQEGILYLEHKYKNVDYTITLTTDNGLVYEGGCVNGVIYNGPIMTLPVQVGDVATVQIVTKDAAAGTVYANMNIVAGNSDSPIKVKSNGIEVYVGAGETVYFQDDTLNADYATKGLLVEGSVDETVFYTVSVNSTSGAVVKNAVTDSDKDDTIEATLGGSLGTAGAPAVKPSWAIENNSAEDRCFVLNVVNDAHECVYDDDADADCNTCGAVRELPAACEHSYDSNCDTACSKCGEETRPEAPHYPSVYPCNNYCTVCLTPLGNTAAHVDQDGDGWCDVCYVRLGCDDGYHTYDGNCDADCNECGEPRVAPHSSSGYPCYNYCIVCLTPLGNTATHVDEDGDTFCDVCRTPLGCDYGYHTYDGNCDADCNECGEPRVAPHYPSGYPCNNYCAVCMTPLENTADHVDEDSNTRCDVCYELLSCEDGYHTYDGNCDADCNECGEPRVASHSSSGYPCNNYCIVCLTTLGNTADHVDEDGDTLCDVCYVRLGCDYGYHTYDYDCDTACRECGEDTRPEAPHYPSGYPCNNYCTMCLTTLENTADHVDQNSDGWCDVCYEPLSCEDGYHTYDGNCDADCDKCGEPRVAPHYPSGYPCNNYCAVCLTTLENTADHVDQDGDGWCDVCYEPLSCEDGYHTYDGKCDADCNECGEPRVAPHFPSGYPCNNYCAVCLTPLGNTADHVDQDGDGSCEVCYVRLGCDYGYHTYDYDCDTACRECGEDTRPEAEHAFDHAFDTTCDFCGIDRRIIADNWFTWSGVSISEDVNGLAFKYDVKVDGMEANGTTAVYDNATIEGFKLIGMGVVVSNNAALSHPTLEDVDGVRIVNVPVVYLCNLYNEAEDTVSFAVRVKNIPDEHKDTTIWFHGYFIVEIDGVETVIYDTGAAGAYNWY